MRNFRVYIPIIIGLIFILSSLTFYKVMQNSSTRPEKPSFIQSAIIGGMEDVTPVNKLRSSWLLLMGGGSDVTPAFSEHAFPKIKVGNVLVLRESGGMAYNDYFASIAKYQSVANVETILVDSVDAANSEYVSWAIDHAEMIWFAGGNQTNVLNTWRGSKLQEHIQQAVRRGVILGGTSSGLTILSEEIYAPPSEYRGSTGEEALLDPYNMRMTTQPRFLEFQQFEKINLLIDGHTSQRERQGRVMALLSRKIVEEQDFSWKMLALDEETAVFLNPEAVGVVITQQENAQVMLFCADDHTIFNVVEKGKPLNVQNLAVWEFKNGDTIDLNRKPQSEPVRYSTNGNGRFTVVIPNENALKE
ncbi:MAG: cyanophycinase [Sumerlaeia bacterium]